MRRPLLAAAAVAAIVAIAAAACGGNGGRAEPAVLVGAGDIASCGRNASARTAALIEKVDGTVFTTGDNVYLRGTRSEYERCYGRTWGRFKDRTRPAAGNHDLVTQDGRPYLEYFDTELQYSYDLDDWHVVVLNTNARIGEQLAWLIDDLDGRDNLCTLAYWHHPRFSSGAKAPGYVQVAPLWQALYEHGAEVVLNGDDHVYERFAPQRPDGSRDSTRGIRQFTVGTGGFDLYRFKTRLPNSERQIEGRHGVLRLDLGERGYGWEFVDAGGSVRDSGSARCHE